MYAIGCPKVFLWAQKRGLISESVTCLYMLFAIFCRVLALYGIIFANFVQY